MAKSEILKELANNGVSLDVALSRLMIIASDIGDSKLQQWALNELNGYDGNEKFPPYRMLEGELIYSGINGTFKVNKLKLDKGFLSEETREALKKPVRFGNGMTVVLASLEKDEQFSIDMTWLAGEVYQNSDYQIQCTSISMVFNKALIQNVIGNVRTKLLQIFIELDKNYGNLDELDVVNKIDNEKEVQNNIHQIIFQDNSTKVDIGDNNKIDKSDLIAGDKVNEPKNR